MPDFAVRTAFTATDGITPAFNRMSMSAEKFGKKTSTTMTMIGSAMSAAGVFGAIGLITMGIKGLVSETSKMENAVAMFTPLLDGAENAAKMVDELNKVAAKTPYQFEQLTGPTNMLLGLGGVMQNDVAKTLTMIGDLAGGSADHLNGITVAYSQVRAAGKMNLMDLMQFTNGGVPLLGQLAKQWGVTNAKAREMIKTKGTFAEVEKAMIAMTSKGGKFFNAMDLQSATLSGRFSTFKDNVALTAAAIGTQLLPYMKSAVDTFIDISSSMRTFIEANQESIKSITGFLIPAIGWAIKLFIAWKFAMITHAAVMKTLYAVEMFKFIKLMGGFRLVVLKATVAQWALNAAFLANPITWVVIGIMALVAAGVLLYKNWTVVKDFFVKFWNDWKGLITLAMLPLWPFIQAGKIIIENWAPIADFFSWLWNGIKIGAEAVLPILQKVVDISMMPAKLLGKGLALAEQGARYLTSPNEAAANLQGGGTTVNINSNGTEAKAEITPRQGAKVNMNKLGYQR